LRVLRIFNGVERKEVRGKIPKKGKKRKTTR
jgi:hypothetical protein